VHSTFLLLVVALSLLLLLLLLQLPLLLLVVVLIEVTVSVLGGLLHFLWGAKGFLIFENASILFFVDSQSFLG
jgi:hypothetical protein